MKSILKFIFNIEYKGADRIITIFGIRITTKSFILNIVLNIDRKLSELVYLSNYNYSNKSLSKLNIYKLFDRNYNLLKLKIYETYSKLGNYKKSNLYLTNNLRILFDLRIYEMSLDRGIGRYIYCLIDNILKNYPEIEISIIKYNENQHPVFNYNNDKIKYYYHNKLKDYKFERKFEFLFFDDTLCQGTFIGSKINDIDNFFENIFPEKILNASKRIVTIGHDLIPLALNIETTNNIEYFIQLESIFILEHIFTNSETTKRDFVKYLNIDKNKLTAIYGGVDSKFINVIKSCDYSIKSRGNHVIFISHPEDRKNVKGLIKGFSIAYNQKRIPEDSKLYLCGKCYEETLKDIEIEIKNSNLTNKQIILTGYISDEELIKLIYSSKANFLPSFYEGLGLPILESYALSTPSFASNVSSTKELVLEECSFDPYDENDIANSIVKAFNDEEFCKKSVEFGKKLLEEKCNWDIASKKVVEKLKELNQNVVLDKAIFIEYNDYKLFSYDNSHVFTTITNYNDFEEINNSSLAKEYNNDFIPVEYYNKFLDKYEYNKKIFALGNSDILQYAIKEEDKNNSYLLIYKIEIFNILFDYFSNYLIDDFKKLIKNHYPNYYELIKEINDINKIFNLLIENKIYGFKILFNLTNINNVITNQENIKNLILNEIKDFKININLVNNLI